MKELWSFLICLFRDGGKHAKAIRKAKSPAEYEDRAAAVFRELELAADLRRTGLIWTGKDGQNEESGLYRQWEHGGRSDPGGLPAVGPEQVIIADARRDMAEALAAELGCSAADNGGAVAGAEYIFLCVKPQVLPAVAAELVPALNACRRGGRTRCWCPSLPG